MELKLTKRYKKVLYKPINIVMLYFIVLIVLYVFGPLEWNTDNALLFYLFILCSHLLLYLGYKTKIQFKINSNEYDATDNNLLVKDSSILKYLRYAIIINFFFTMMNLIRYIGLTSFSFSNIIDKLVTGILNPGDQYNLKFQTEKTFGGGLLPKLSTLFAPILWPVIPLALFYYKKIGFINKILIILTVIAEVTRWIAVGTNKGVIDVILILVSVLFLKSQQRIFNGYVKKVKFRNKRGRIFLIVLFLIIIGLSLFLNNISSRINNNYQTISILANYTQINLDAPLTKVFPNNLQPLLVYASSYLTQGYYGLSLTLDEPFIPMFGIGNSYFLLSNIEELLDIDLWQYTYQARIAYKGWSPFLNWHSIYAWLANDVSFLGVLILMYILGKYFALVYYRAVVYKDPITSVLFCLLIMSFFYFSSNNQVLSHPTTFMAFWALNIFWFIKSKILRRRKSVVIKSNNYLYATNERYE